jgi:predicted nucleic acid-binding protein
MIVLDASAAIELLSRTEAGGRVQQFLHTERVLHAPQVLDIEVLQALRNLAHASAAERKLAPARCAGFLSLRIIRYPHQPLRSRIWDLRDNFTAYDACYLALAESLNATLVTCDQALKSAKLKQGRVHLV